MEFRDDQPIYLQIAEHFCENILLDKWKPGDRIPSVREMAVMIEVNPNTVVRTYNLLQDRGIIYNKRGIGYFVSDDGYQKTRNFRKEDFVEQELPRVFRAMKMLDLSMEDIAKYYQQFDDNKEKDENK